MLLKGTHKYECISLYNYLPSEKLKLNTCRLVFISFRIKEFKSDSISPIVTILFGYTLTCFSLMYIELL